MGRAERRKLERLNRRDKQRQADEIHPIIDGDTLIYPVKASGDFSGKTGSEMLTPEEFLRETADISDKELNKLLYAQAKQAIELGFNPEWPEDDFGTVMWFTWSFITPEMRETFPAIAHEYLSNEELVKNGHIFSDIYIYTDALQHKQYYKAMNIINSGNKMLFYLGSTNINENLRRFYSDLCMRR